MAEGLPLRPREQDDVEILELEMPRGNTRDLRVLWALEELGLPSEIVGLDHPNHDLSNSSHHR